MRHLDLWATLAAAGSLWVTFRKALAMFKVAKQVIFAVLMVVMAVELQAEGKGAEKKAAAAEQVRKLLDPLLPDWANPIVVTSTDWLIDVLVGVANRTGFFAQFATDLSS